MNLRPKILIVDDEPMNVDYLEQELADLTYDTISAENGQKALDKAQAETPDLILLDIMMPGMDGFAVMAKLKASASLRDIPVIIISAMNDLKSVVKGIELGAEDYLPKPFEPALLKARLSASLEKKSLRDLQALYLKGLERELDIGREIQLGFLPSELPKVEGWEIAAYFKSAREVAGDFYDAFILPDGNLAIILADICGKGVGAALFMTLFRSLLRATSTTDHFTREKNQKNLAPGKRLKQAIYFTNDYILETHGDTNMFATVFFGILEPVSGKLSYINAGNEPPLIISKNGSLKPLDPTGPVVGIIPKVTFSVKEIFLGNEDTLLAFTDGIPDNKNPKDEFFGKERLFTLLHDREITATDLVNTIGTQLMEFTGVAEQFDDITLMAIKRIDK
jgi:serine phosphatase RsbU (regulator of sigma subunit)